MAATGGMEPVVQLGNKYAEQFSTTAESIRQRGSTAQQEVTAKVAELHELAQTSTQTAELTARDVQNYAMAALTDMTPAPADVAQRTLEVHSWVAVCLLGVAAGRVLGAMLAPLLAIAFQGYMAAVLALGLLPAWMYYYNRSMRSESVSEDDRRMVLLAIAAVMGVADGFVFADVYVLSSPLPAVGFAASAVVATLAAQQAENRTVFLGATVGALAAVHLVLGMLVLGITVGYMVETALLAGIAFAGIQFSIAKGRMLGNVSSVDLVEQQLALVASVLVAQALSAFVFGTDKEGYDSARAQQQA